MLFSHTGKGGMTCAIEQHPGRGHGTRPRHIEDGTPAECCVAGPGSCSPRKGTSGSERHRDASCIAQAFRLPRLPNRLFGGMVRQPLARQSKLYGRF